MEIKWNIVSFVTRGDEDTFKLQFHVVGVIQLN